MKHHRKKEELQKWFKNSDLGIRRFFNTSGILYREMGLKDKVEQMTEDEAFTLLATDGKLIKRPIVTDGKKSDTWFQGKRICRKLEVNMDLKGDLLR